MSNKRNNPDFSISKIVNDRKKSKNTIDTFGSVDFGSADFGKGFEGADFGYESQAQSHSMNGFGNEMWNEFQRQGVSCDDQIDEPLSYSEIDYSDEQAYSSTRYDESEAVDSQESIEIPEDAHIQIQEEAKQKVAELLKAQGIDQSTISKAQGIIEKAITPQAAVALVKEKVEVSRTFNHPLLGAVRKNNPMSGLFDALSDAWVQTRDNIVAQAQTVIPAAAQAAVVTAVNTAVNSGATAITKQLNTVVASPQTQALISTGANTMLSQLQAKVKEQASLIWKDYKMPIIAGGVGFVGLITYLIVRKRK